MLWYEKTYEEEYKQWMEGNRPKRVSGEWGWNKNKGISLHLGWKVSKAWGSFRKCGWYLLQSVGYKFYKPSEKRKEVLRNKLIDTGRSK